VALLAEDAITDTEIAEACGISRQQLWLWKKQPAFAQRLREGRERLADEALRYAVARKRNRMRRMNDRRERGHRLIEERAADPAMATVPGGTTGLLTTKQTPLGPQYEVDTGLLASLLNLERAAAVEAGQWTEKTATTLTISDTLRQEAQRLADELGISVEELIADAEHMLEGPHGR
jgi:hypothetical protein